MIKHPTNGNIEAHLIEISYLLRLNETIFEKK